MDKSEVFLVNLLPEQVRPPDVAKVNLRTPPVDHRMLKPEVVDLIHALAGRGLGSKQIARQLAISRNSVRRYLAGARVGFQERPEARRLDAAARQEVQRLFETVAEGNTGVVPQELAEDGTQVDLRTLPRAVTPLRPAARARALATVRFETGPGQQVQIDFGQKIVSIAGVAVTVHLMTVVLGPARRPYCQAFLAERQDDWLEGIDGACRHFGGLPVEVLCDNASPLVISHDPTTGVVVWHPGFEAFCKDRGITPRACRPRRARTKGKIERGVGPVQHNALAGRAFASFDAVQRHLTRWPTEVADRRIHGTTHEQPSVRFERDERQTLRPLPTRPLAVRTRRLTRRVRADCFVDVGPIRYSVPHRHVRETVEVVVGVDHVEVWLRGASVARHPRSLEPRSWVRDPAHFPGRYRPGPSPSPTATPATAAPPAAVVRPLSVYAEVVDGGRP